MRLPLKPLKNNKPSLVGLTGEKLETKKPYILIGMPTYRFDVEPKTRECMNAMLSYMKEAGFRIGVYQSDSALVAKGRNDAVATAQELGADYLMFIDSDMAFEPNHVEMLFDHHKDVVGGLCTKRVPPYTSTVYFYREEEGSYVPVDAADPNAVVLDSLIECDGTGTAFLLIKMSVFDKLKKPYFAMPPIGWNEVVKAARKIEKVYHIGGTPKSGDVDNLKSAIDFADRIDGFQGEDLFLCNQLREAKIPVFVDAGILIGHMGDYPFTYIDRIGLVEVQGVERLEPNKAKSGGDEDGVPASAGAGVSALLLATQKAKTVSSVPS